MPEGPEVHSQADGLRACLKGQTVTKIRFRKGWTLRHKLDSEAETLMADLPLVVRNVWARGKKIIIRFNGNYYMVVALGMEGRWSHVALGHSHVYIETAEGKRIWYDDHRYFGKFEFYSSKAELCERLSEIGPDLISDVITSEDWLEVVTSPKLRSKHVCEFLMDQKYFSGVGNYIKAEVLYQARIRPDALLSEISHKTLVSLFKIIRRLIQESYQAQGASLRTYINVDGAKGNFQVEVYGKLEDPNGEEVITSIFKDDRMTHWVPSVQVLPTPWSGYERLSVRKLRATQGSKGYARWELRSFCHQQGISTEGTKPTLVKRLLTNISE